MKKALPFFIIILWILMASLTGCEEIIIEKVILDTVYVDRPVPQLIAGPTLVKIDSFIRVDTVEVRVIVKEVVVNEVVKTDTVFLVVTDSVFIERIVERTVIQYDTVILTQVIEHFDTTYIDRIVQVTDTVETIVEVNQVIYHDSLYIPIFDRVINSIPSEILPHIQEFYALAGQHGWSFQGGPMLVVYVRENDLPGEGWNSNSYWIGGNYGNMYIELNEELPTEQQRASIFRELARLQLKKKYVTDESKILCPWWNPETQINTNHLNELFANPQPI